MPSPSSRRRRPRHDRVEELRRTARRRDSPETLEDRERRLQLQCGRVDLTGRLVIGEGARSIATDHDCADELLVKDTTIVPGDR